MTCVSTNLSSRKSIDSSHGRTRSLRLTKWRHNLSPPPQFGHELEGTILQPLAPVVSAATTHKTFGPTKLTNTYSVCTRTVFNGIEPELSSLESNALATRPPTAQRLQIKGQKEKS
ncbi:hypothetical protein TNCV_1187141 [Trichonephila clavipes]|nr:hypothetical protein TNCV_1187141 [Trichonephila clavipes]